MTRRYLAFDLEISKSIPDGCKDWKEHRPLGISCAATWASDEPEPHLMYGVWDDGEAGGKEHILPQMERIDAQVVVENLLLSVEEGYTLLTWNGLSFDFDVLAEESGMFDECCDLALNHVDMMFHIFCEKGHPLGLNTAALGMGVQGKTEGVSGAQAPQLWAEGKYDEVLAYVAQDVRCTLDLALAVEKYRRLLWVARSGRRNLLSVPQWLTVKECLEIPEPDTSWMTAPMKRSDMLAWMQRETV